MWHGQWRHRFLFGRGMVSDDTEHTLFVAQALLTHPDDVIAFQRCLAWKLRLWLLGLPAGIGLATLKAILKLWVGISPSRSGVWSAGNGPAMRSAIIGAYFAADPAKRRAFVSASTRLTHTDPKAETAALAVAEAAAWAVNQNEPIEQWLTRLSGLGCDEEWIGICEKLADALASAKSVAEFADSLGLQKGVTGYAYHSVPVALYAWLRHQGFPHRLGGRAGLWRGHGHGGRHRRGVRGRQGWERRAFPLNWSPGFANGRVRFACWNKLLPGWRNRKHRAGARARPLFLAGTVLRNLLFLVVVLTHGFRRLAPPY